MQVYWLFSGGIVQHRTYSGVSLFAHYSLQHVLAHINLNTLVDYALKHVS